MKLIYKEELEQKNVLSVLKEKLDISSRLIKKNKNRIKINGSIVTVKDNLNVGDELSIEICEEAAEDSFINKYECLDIELSILYEDDYLLIVDKPSGLHIHPSMMDTTNTLSNRVASYLSKQKLYGIHIVTRLDKGTSGICVFAKNAYVQELFIKRKNKIKFYKEYIMVVNGILERDHFFVEAPIARKPNSIIEREVNENGQYAKTEVNTISRDLNKKTTIARAILHTGRTHQIRVHMNYIGHPLVGDSLYSLENVSEGISRPALHCAKVVFYHPITFEEIKIESKIPEDILKILCG